MQEGEIEAEYTEVELNLCLRIVGELSPKGAVPGMSTGGRMVRNEQLYMAGVMRRA